MDKNHVTKHTVNFCTADGHKSPPRTSVEVLVTGCLFRGAPKYEVITAVILRIHVISTVTPSRWVNGYRYFAGF